MLGSSAPVMVWTPEHTGLFLDHIAEDRLYPLFHLIAFRGLRRGEACGQKWTDTNLDAGLITVAEQLVVEGWEVYADDPKTDAGARTIALGSDTVQALKRHRAQQNKDRKEWESAWVETGRVFTKENGEMLHPANVTRRFIELYEEIDLPPVRLHDLRHGAATLAHAAGADLKDIQEMLGHSSITITADTYRACFPKRAWRLPRPQPGSFRAPAPPLKTPPPRRRPSPTTRSIPARSPCRMMLIRWEEFRRSTLRPLTHRSRKRPRTRGPRPSRSPPWGTNPRAER
ncbi:site-specific integrase [Streptomyces sp. NPDC050164]|uniref:site-specific integrase n=1 Tax=Streptomyces sp. NPDC050164 TaxID=3365605 RepID=UPI003797006E